MVIEYSASILKQTDTKGNNNKNGNLAMDIPLDGTSFPLFRVELECQFFRKRSKHLELDSDSEGCKFQTRLTEFLIELKSVQR